MKSPKSPKSPRTRPSGGRSRRQAKSASPARRRGGVGAAAGIPRERRVSQAERIQGPSLRDPARWVVGLHSCMETLRVRPRSVREVWLREDWESSQQLRELAEIAQRHRLVLRGRTTGQLDQVGNGHQGVALAALEAPVLDWADLETPGPCVVLALDGIEDPHNLGAILRTGWLAGVAAVLIPEDRAVGLTPAACKVASGGAEHLPVESFSNLPSILQKLKDLGFWIFGLSEKGKRKPWEFTLPEKVVWVIGSEGSGMRVPTERACDELVRIPQVSTGSSYNASIATAMALVETCRQFGKPE